MERMRPAPPAGDVVYVRRRKMFKGAIDLKINAVNTNLDSLTVKFKGFH